MKNVLILFMLISVSAGCYAEEMNFRGNFSDEFGGERGSFNDNNTLKLDETTRYKLNIIEMDLKTNIEEVSKSLLKVETKMKELLSDRNFNEEIVKRFIYEKSKIKEIILLFRFNALLKIRKILSNEEWTLYMKIRERKVPSQGDSRLPKGSRPMGPPPGMGY